MTAIALCSFSISYGQMFFDFGAKGAFGPTILFNSDIFDADSYDHKATMGYAFGGKFGVHFNGRNGITLDIMSQKSKQEFDVSPVNSIDLLQWNHTDYMLMYRYSGNGAYIELGPKLSRISEVTHELNGQSTTVAGTEFYEDSYLSGVFGFGSYLAGSDLFTLQLGIRLHWGLDDIVAPGGKTDGNNFPTPFSGEVLNAAKSTATAAMLHVEFNYAFGRFAKTECSGRRKLILFQ